MAEKGTKNIMPVELAIQRELAYREKMACFLSEKEKAELLPLKMPCSTKSTSPYESSILCVSQSSTSAPKPGPGRFPTSVFAPQSSNQGRSPTPVPESRLGKPWQHHISNSSETFCKICKEQFSNPSVYKQHIRGEKHKATLHVPKLIINNPTIGPAKYRPPRSPKLINNATVGPAKYLPPGCNLCQIVCTDETSLKLHLNGQKHKATLRKIELGKEGGTSEHFWCELCQVPCNNEETFQLHLKGKKHLLADVLWSENKVI